MKYIIIKEVRIDNDGLFNKEQTWFIVRLENPILHTLIDAYRPFLSLEEARECVKLLEEGKWKYTKSREVIE